VTVAQVCAVVQARNEEASIANVISQLWRAGVAYSVIVVNGSRDKTAQIAQRVARDGTGLPAARMRCTVLTANIPLGHDVGKAVGVYAARRLRWPVHIYVFVDGDWNGGFGPRLAQWLDRAVEEDSDIALTQWAPQTQVSRWERPDWEIWQDVFSLHWPNLLGTAASQAPMAVRGTVFDRISPYWLHQPSKWLAYALMLQPQLKVTASPEIQAALVGNPSRSATHQHLMLETLLGDAVEAARITVGRQGGRWWQGRERIGYHRYRRTDVLRQYMAQSSSVFGVAIGNL